MSKDETVITISDQNDQYDAVFGEQVDGQVRYTSMGWIQTTIVLLKIQIALGVLGMPTVLQAVGAVPGVLIILLIGLITGWSGYIVKMFKLNHPEVYGIPDVGYVLFGTIGREFFTYSYAVFIITTISAGLVPITIAFDTLANGKVCAIAWYVIAAIGMWAFASIQTLNRVSWIGWIGFACIMTGILTVSVAVGVQERPAAAPQSGPWDKDIHAFRSADFLQAVSAMSSALFGYCGTPSFFAVISEMRDPRQFGRSLTACYSIVVSTYVTIGIVVYYYCGQYLASPALGSAGILMQKVSYGLALPGLYASVIIYCHCAAKVVFVRVLRNSEHLTAHSKVHWMVWLSTTAGCTILAFIVAEVIPFFSALSILVASLFGTLMCLQFSGWMWLHDNWNRRSTGPTVGFWCLASLCWFMIVFGFFLQIAGAVAGVKAIINSYATGAVVSPFSCSIA